jgi:putative aldouronate transport system permease protein
VLSRDASALSVKKKKSLRLDWLSFRIISVLIILPFVALCIIPFYLIIVASFTDENEIVQQGYSFFVSKFSLGGYELVLKNPEAILRSYGMTIFVTVAGTVLALILCVMTGFILSRKDFPWRNGFSFFFFFTTLFGGGLVPWYLLCTKVLNFSDHIYAMILPLMFSVWNMIIAKSFIRSGVPFEIVESGKIDGANDIQIFFQLILPLTKPLLATLGLFTALAYWNDWYNCMLFIKDGNLYTLQYYLQEILNSAEALKIVAAKSGMDVKVLPMESMKMAMTVVATGPIILLYPLLQKYFVKGLTIGAVKG